MNGYVLEIAAFAVCLFCLMGSSGLRRRNELGFPKGFINKLKDRRFLFVSILICLMISAVSDLLDIFIGLYIVDRSVFAVEALNEVYFVFHSLLPALFVLYVINITEASAKNGKTFFLIYGIPLFVSEAFVLINPLTHWLFYVDENILYARGSLMWLLYAVAAVYSVIGTVYFFLYRKKISKIESLTMFIILLIAVAGMVIQGLFAFKAELFFDSIGLLCYLLLLNRSEDEDGKKKTRGISKRVLLTSTIVFVLFASTGMLFLISYQKASESLASQMEKNYSTMADKYAQELTAWVATKSMIVESLAVDITASGIYESGYDEFHGYLAKCHEQLNDDGVIYDLYFTYPDNTMACATDFIPDGSVDYVNDREWFTVAAGTGRLFYSTPYMDSDTGNPVITISKGIYEDNTLQGVLAADIFVDRLVNIISEAEVARDSYAFLVDQNLAMIVHPDKAYDFDDVPHGVMEIPDAPYAEVVSKIRSGSSETVYLKDYDGITRGFVVSRVENAGWYVGIATSEAELMQDFGPLIRGFLIVSVMAILIGCAVAVFLAYILDRSSSQQEEYEAKLRELRKQIEEAGRPRDRILSDTAPETDDEEIYEPEKRTSDRVKQIAPMVLIPLLMTGMMIYTTGVIRDVSATNIREVGEDRISASAAELENYLETAKSTLWVTADTVDHMVEKGASTDEILSYITKETDNQKQNFDVNYNGVYGYVSGEYIDGLGWTPPENFDPTRRDWYISAIEAKGDAVIVSPYVDAQTDSTIFSISRMLSNGKDVISVDVMMDHIQEIVSGLQIKEKGYGFIVDRKGMLIAHHDEDKKGGYLTNEEENLDLFDRILEVCDGSFEINTDDTNSTVFVRQITDQWYAVIIVGSDELMAEVFQQLVVTVLICVAIFALIILFYLFGRKAEQNYTKRLAEMRAEKQKQAYEAVTLKLEKEAADHANRAKSDFLANMSHEIRTPINTVLGMNEMILRESTDPSIKEYAANIHSAGRNLLGLINSILDFSKIEEGKMEIIAVKYDTATMIGNIINSISTRASDKGLTFEAHIDETLPSSLFGDDLRVSQVAVNLLTNAVKYTKEGRVDLYIDGKPADDDSISLRVRVRDTGIGIKEEDMSRLFESFTRLEENRNRTIEGTGLGMSIVNRLLDMMGSKLEVHSTYGAGSEFSFEVKQRVIDSRPIGDYETKAREVLEHEENGTYLYAPDAKLLIVDDNEMNLKVVVNLLKLNGIVPELAGSGAEALEKMSGSIYDVILLDHMMPEMDGIETLKVAREKGLIAEGCYVIVLTANAVVGARETYIGAGFDDYLSKPIEVRALESILGRFLPAEKVTYRSRTDIPEAVPDGNAGAQETGTDLLYKTLEDNGINTRSALNFCGGNDTFYRNLLSEFSASSGKMIKVLGDAIGSDDLKTYAINIHSLKSLSRTIGAVELSDAAAALEKAADSGETDTVRAGHAAFLEKYRGIVSVIASADISGSAVPDDDDEIMEFMPQ